MSSQDLKPKEAAERLGITTRWLAELSKRGTLPKRGSGKQAMHPWPALRDAFNVHLREQGALEATLADLQAERAALVRVQRQTAELDLAVKRRQLVTVDDATAESDRLAQFVRAKLLNLPGRLSPALVGLGTIADAVERLDDGIRETLAELVAQADDYEHHPTRSTKRANRKRPKRAARAS